ncbi:SDR family NAD(P)-dependent oxidoreductase [Nocardioides zeae]|uniref:SDR family NAD(P)-dependent oxidoreductase n=1 Tax=Nocardioides imazamoxiresistens TaxID=3231893 RepID=A0ABU3PY46_9ACTN|nr:SDR family NAD(P)-dependent oxidoreductase [Nocardioides zeae]MDT9593700.1 SDR family NAD(P)-dependent oxidoreductase [Nocardioides zeae]
MTGAGQQDGRVVLVTGASSGIGRATATAAGARGDHVVLAARSEAELEAAAEEARAAGAASVLHRRVDVGDDGAVAALVAAVLERHGRIDAVVHAAGVAAYGRVEDLPAAVFEGVVRTNLLGSASVARHVVPVLRRQGGGSLLLVGSVLGHAGAPTMTAYVVSKWGVRALARQLRIENRDVPGVRIGYVAPGGVDTPIYRQAATVVGVEGRPPPPVVGAERVAAQVLDRLGGRLQRPQLTPVNHLLRLGYSALPGVYDRVVGPAFRVLATDLVRPVPPTDGNVLAAQERKESARGPETGPLPAARNLVRNLRVLVRGGRG